LGKIVISFSPSEESKYNAFLRAKLISAPAQIFGQHKFKLNICVAQSQ
jgi:hypothetical protein